MDSQRKRSTLQRLFVVCPMNDNQEGPLAVHEVLIDVDPERVREDARNPWPVGTRFSAIAVRTPKGPQSLEIMTAR